MVCVGGRSRRVAELRRRRGLAARALAARTPRSAAVVLGASPAAIGGWIEPTGSPVSERPCLWDGGPRGAGSRRISCGRELAGLCWLDWAERVGARAAL